MARPVNADPEETRARIIRSQALSVPPLADPIEEQRAVVSKCRVCARGQSIQPVPQPKKRPTHHNRVISAELACC